MGDGARAIKSDCRQELNRRDEARVDEYAAQYPASDRETVREGMQLANARACSQADHHQARGDYFEAADALSDRKMDGAMKEVQDRAEHRKAVSRFFSEPGTVLREWGSDLSQKASDAKLSMAGWAQSAKDFIGI